MVTIKELSLFSEKFAAELQAAKRTSAELWAGIEGTLQ